MFQIRWLWRYMGEKRRYLIIGMLIAAVTSGMLIINPMLSQKLIDEVITPQNTHMLLPILGTMMAVQLVRIALRYIMIVLLEINSQVVMNDTRRRLYDVIQNEDYLFFGRMRTGDLMTRMTNDLDLVRHTSSWISYVTVDAITTFVVAIIYLLTVSWQLTLCLAAVTPLILIVTSMFSRKVRPMYVALREKLTTMSTVAQENIGGNRVVKAFAREEFEKEKFGKENVEYRQMNMKTAYIGAGFQSVLDLLAQSLTVITLVVGGVFMINGKLTAGQMMAFSSLTWALANPLRTLGMLISDIQRFFASSSRIIEVFYARPVITNRYKAKDMDKKPEGELEFKDVSFEINGNKILSDINFHLEPGQTMGILSSTGSGKTSLINMITRFYQPSEGQVLLDGEDVQIHTLSSLRRSIGLAMQDVFLFSDSVEGNIAYGDTTLAFEEVEKRAKQADADAFIKRMADGYDTLIGERGVGLSGGQKQRISLARALAVKPSVLILDDTTSAVDMETERYIQKQLRELDYACTKIIIAQRISSFQDADLILVMDEGEIIERGTHTELMEQKGYYYRIWALQNNVELENGEVDNHGA